MSWLSSLKPVSSLPEYSGPYKVGSIDVEIPVADLDSPSPAPDSSLSTVAYRIFYPCEPSANDRPVRWIPNPQRGYMAAYARFMGANSAFASVFAYVRFHQLQSHCLFATDSSPNSCTTSTFPSTGMRHSFRPQPNSPVGQSWSFRTA